MILFKDQVAADFLVRSIESHNIGLGWSWDILVCTVWIFSRILERFDKKNNYVIANNLLRT
jgi:hypothetical protein